ncbi:lysophospholipid acyltransferase family protein [Yunchengibacter salinarum]|uniref:lysophospholipid acyltransferase family protein n=1 Tax=Yunchengibacter salinarum TaxID=3133399 RepID=UPI0035B643C6
MSKSAASAAEAAIVPRRGPVRKGVDAIRSVLFNLAFYGFNLIYLPLVVLPATLVAGEGAIRRLIWVYCRSSVFLARWVMGIRLVYDGEEALPRTGPIIIAAAHQSNMDPIITYLLRSDVTALAKKELFRVPVIGRVLSRIGIVKVDRQSGRAHRGMDQVGEAVRAEGKALIVYPQATRVKPGDRRKLKSGAYHLQQDTGLPVYPVATNTGLFWRKGFFHRSGVAVFRVGEKLPHNLSKAAFMERLTDTVVHDSEALAEAAGFTRELEKQRT